MKEAVQRVKEVIGMRAGGEEVPGVQRKIKIVQSRKHPMGSLPYNKEAVQRVKEVLSMRECDAEVPEAQCNTKRSRKAGNVQLGAFLISKRVDSYMVPSQRPPFRPRQPNCPPPTKLVSPRINGDA